MIDMSKVKRKVNVAAGVIIKEGNNGEQLLLLIRRSKEDHWSNVWEFPRGKCDKPKGEDLIKCCKREIKEETGLDVEPVFEIDTFQYLADDGERLSTCHNFYCKMKNPKQEVKLVKNPESGILEHDAFQWIQSVGEAQLLVFPDQRKTIEKIFNKKIKIINYPDNDFTKNNNVEEQKMLLDEYLEKLTR